MTKRFDRAATATVNCLRVLPEAGESGYPSPGQLVAGLAIILRTRLGPIERLTVASAAMLSLDREAAENLAEATLTDLRSGSPIAPFTTLREEARSWAAWASPGERRVYMAACWGKLPEAERQGFLRAVRASKQRAAA
jgi:hypothetical protein